MTDRPSAERPRIVAFDLDGTLVDSVGDIAAALNAAFVEVGLPPLPEDAVRGSIGNGVRLLVTRAVAGRAPLDAVLERFRAHYDAGLVERTVAFPGIAALLRALSLRARLAVATNKPGAPARKIVEVLFPGSVDLVLGPDDAGCLLKPAPDMLAAIAERLAGDVAVFVGDSGVDEETARNAGVAFVGVSWGLRPEELMGPDIAHDADELALLINRHL